MFEEYKPPKEKSYSLTRTSTLYDVKAHLDMLEKERLKAKTRLFEVEQHIESIKTLLANKYADNKYEVNDCKGVLGLNETSCIVTKDTDVSGKNFTIIFPRYMVLTQDNIKLKKVYDDLEDEKLKNEFVIGVNLDCFDNPELKERIKNYVDIDYIYKTPIIREA